mmetsp:Transcript_53411/g.95847  ORF Transcript_53411/g.95847 Transcript_53411/m.95847 type:complete len:483 (+) Transcript_53411:39-1487(+)|eukprot:CAMPEP_0197664222 /NCGR_PEP_ID=MMETSP1338-20131121/58502_1 /TAXON_ID=43686 ORGANISM="Pelagodinium beii, Strain RCC1491" /NCGR_SAMPLE_ID=MMETSP1338 /ASSEMBLY_ACC=CAM_ASM_000754 /LENGTH=482 /DNA_ID=CAMNT_0043242811 /DNA_START=39 /DNA_END=1487 /DNA_ORIENTATION=-
MMRAATVALGSSIVFLTLGKRLEETAQEVLATNIAEAAHLKLAAFGKDLDEYIKNVELNRQRHEELSLHEVNATVGKEKWGKFCPKAWRDRVQNEGQYVGGGAFGKVYVTKIECSPNPKTVAIKVQKKNHDSIEESKLMIKLNHGHLIKAFESAEGPSPGQLSLLMEAAAGGSFEKIARLEEKEKARLIYEALEGVAYMHGLNLIHSDLKPDNILLSGKCGGSVVCHSKVADFGLSVEDAPGKNSGLAGSPLWMAPEACKTHKRSKSNDLWAMGVIVHEMIKGTRPIFLERAPTVDALIQKIAGQSQPYQPRSSSLGEILLSKLLVPNPRERVNAKDAAALAKKWWLSFANSDEEQLHVPALPSCWRSCAVAGCAKVSKKCSVKEDGVARCGEDEGPAGQLDDGLIEITIRKGYAGKLGFRTNQDEGRVDRITPGSPADRAGLREGDLIKTLQGRPWQGFTYEKRLDIIMYDPDVTLEVVRR